MRKTLILGVAAGTLLSFATASFAESGGFTDREKREVYHTFSRPPVAYAYPQSYEQTGAIYARPGYWRYQRPVYQGPVNQPYGYNYAYPDDEQ